VKDGLGYSRDYASVSQSLTTSPATLTATNAGTYKAKPVITLIFDAASSVTVVDIQRLDSTGTVQEEIQYSGTVAANDVLVFDAEQGSVTKNGTAVLYSGTFPFVEPGSNNVKVTITGTSFTAYATVKQKDTYL